MSNSTITSKKKLYQILLKENSSVSNKSANKKVGFGVILEEFKKDKIATVSLFILILIVLCVFVGSLMIPTKMYTFVDILSKYDPPSNKDIWSILGKDVGGRSVLAILIVGARNSLTIGISVTLLTAIVGIIVGLIVGYFGGIVDNIIMRIIDFIGVLPTTMIIIAFVTAVPKYNMVTFVFIMSIFYWTGMARLVRSKALSEARRDYISASKTLGTNDVKIMLFELLPNIGSIIIVSMTLDLAGNIGIETALSYLGFGMPPETPSLGTLISYASKPEVISDKAWVWLPATVLILVLMLCINYIGQALRRSFDAKQRLG